MKDASRKLLEKSLRSIEAAEELIQSGKEEFAASRAYYAMFYVAEALLYEKDLRFKKHSAVHAAFGKHFTKTGKLDSKYHDWLLEAFEQRLTSDYEIEGSVSKKAVLETTQRAQEFLDQARQYLSQPS